MTISFDPVAVMAGATFCALLWALSALHKLSDWPAYVGQLRDYQVLPPGMQTIAAPLLVLVEILLALAWLFNAARPWAALPSALLLAAYGAAMGYNLAHGRDSIDCGCGGAGQLIRWALVARNGLLSLFSLFPLWSVAPAARALSWLDFLTVTATALTLYGGYVVVNQLLANNPPQRSTR